jgi:hypothetical protein
MTIYRFHQPQRLNQPNGMIPLPDKEEFFHLYQVQNKSRQELALYYKVHKGTIDNWCKKFGVKKTKQQQIDLALRNTSSDNNREGQYNEKLFQKYPHLKSVDGVFYIIRVYNDVESFYKYGITRTTTKDRYKGRFRHYKYDILVEEKMCLYDAFLKETEYKQSHRHLRYEPKHKFGGHTECYISHPPAAEQAKVCTPSTLSTNSLRESHSK